MSNVSHTGSEFARSRAQAEADAEIMRDRAVRTVTGQAVDAEDLLSLLAMLGLERAYGPSALRNGLAGYVRAVAAALGVPSEVTGFEISDTATAYLGLSRRWVLRPSRDLMLVWTEAQGWSVAVETDPAERPAVLGYLGGDEVVPGPHEVARFVTGVVNCRATPSGRPAFGVDRKELARRLNSYASRVH
jgi:hypothetical protein